MSECNLALIISEILNGKVLVFPTETSYGLGCDATNQAAVDRIFKIKGRSDDKPLLVVVNSIEMAKKYLLWNNNLNRLANRYWPGPLTVVGDYATGKLAKGVVAKDNTVAIRVSDYPLIKSITEKIQRPLVATSANLAGQPSLYSATQFFEIFKSQAEQPDIVLNYGDLPVSPHTTIVSAIGSKIKMIRPGGLDVHI